MSGIGCRDRTSRQKSCTDLRTKRKSCRKQTAQRHHSLLLFFIQPPPSIISICQNTNMSHLLVVPGRQTGQPSLQQSPGVWILLIGKTGVECECCLKPGKKKKKIWLHNTTSLLQQPYTYTLIIKSCTHSLTYKLPFNSSLTFLLKSITQNIVASEGELPFVT